MVASSKPRITPLSEAVAQSAGSATKVNGVVSNDPSPSDVVKSISELAIDIVRNAADSWESKMHPGLKFKFKKFSNIVVRDAIKKIPEPQPPEILIEDKERMEPNPNDPKYKDALREYVYKISMVSVHATIILGTTIENVPTGMYKVEDKEWEAPLDLLGLEVPSDPLNRYLHWVRWYALDDEELAQLHGAVRRFNGVVLTSDVEEAQEELKSVSERNSDTGSPANEAS